MVLKRIALTGASGMVGQHCLRVLSEREIKSAVTSRRRPSFLPVGSIWFPWDLKEWKTDEELDELFGDVDAIFHVGALVPGMESVIPIPDLFDANVRACLNIGLWAQKRDIVIVYLSGATVYANPLCAGICEDDPKQSGCGVGGFYGASKWLGEQIFTALTDNSTRACVLRPSSIYGTGLPANKMIPKWLRLAKRGETIVLNQPVTDSMDLIHASDVARAMVDAAEREAYGIYNIASECQKTVAEVAQLCVTLVGRGAVAVSEHVATRKGQLRFGLVCDRARKAFDFSPRIDLKTGIRMMLEEGDANIL